MVDSMRNLDTCASRRGFCMKYLFWRNKTLWCRYPLPGRRWDWSTGIKTTGTRGDRQRCEHDGEMMLAALRTKAMTGQLFEQPAKEKAPYRPKFWRLVGRYFYHHLRFQKSGSNERYHLAHSLKEFGSKFADEVTREDVEVWRQEMVASGASINAVNNRFAYLKATFSWAHKESDARLRVTHDPTIGLSMLTGANVRSFLLTPERFERNLAFLEKESPRFATFYLGLWETGRRPLEVSTYTWEQVQSMEIDGRKVYFFAVPRSATKTDEYDHVVVSDRLWSAISSLAYRHGLVFRNEDGNRWKVWSRHYQKLREKFGDDCGWIRDCRRGFVTRMCETEGHDPLHVRMQSGHRTNAIFERYRIGSIRKQAGLFRGSLDTTETQIARAG